MPCSINLNILSALLRQNSPNYKTIDQIYDRFGPTPRLCLDNTFEPEFLEIYEQETQREIKKLTLQSLQELIFRIRFLDMDDISHKICLIRRKPIHNLRSNFLLTLVVTPITEYIESGLAISMRNHDINQLTETFKLFFPIPFSGGISGYIFENICHQHFRERIHIKYAKMVRLTRDSTKNVPRWHSSHPSHTAKSQASDVIRRDVDRDSVILDVTPSRSRVYDDLKSAFEPDVYYIPEKSNEVAFNSFILHRGCLYIFQFTVSEEQKIDDGLISQFAECTKLPKQGDWCYIFVTPDKVEVLISPLTKSDELQKLNPFSAQVAVEREEPSLKKRKITEAPVEGLEDRDDSHQEKQRMKLRSSTKGKR